MIRWQDDSTGTSNHETQRGVDCTAAWSLAASRLRGQIGRAAVIAADAARCAAVLRAAGLEAVAFEPAGAADTRATADDAALAAFDAIVLVDVLGSRRDDEAVMRSLAARAVAGTRLVGAVLRADVGQQLVAPRRRGFSRESLDAMLVRSGWTPPVQVARTAQLMVFECSRVDDAGTARSLDAARSHDGGSEVATLERLAREAKATRDPAEARELLLALGELQRARGEFEPAEQAFTAANAIAPSCARPVVGLASLALARGERDDAEALFDHALAADATNVDAWRGLATVFEARGERARAIESLECAASLAPADDGIALALSKLLGADGNAPGAAAALERVLPYGDATDAVRNAYCWLVASSRRVASGPNAVATSTPRVVASVWNVPSNTLAS